MSTETNNHDHAPPKDLMIPTRHLNLSVIIPTLNSASLLDACLTALGKAERRGIDLEIVVSDGGSEDDTLRIAEQHGTKIVQGPPGRGLQLHNGAKASNGSWLLFLHSDTILERGWDATAMVFASNKKNIERAAVFSFALDDPAPAARRIEKLVRFRNNWLGLPYGDQGLLIHRRFYRRLEGFEPLPLMEDVNMIRKIGITRLARFDVRAVTSAVRYRNGGYIRRPLRNLMCLGLYFLRVPPRWIAKIYG